MPVPFNIVGIDHVVSRAATTQRCCPDLTHPHAGDIVARAVACLDRGAGNDDTRAVRDIVTLGP